MRTHPDANRSDKDRPTRLPRRTFVRNLGLLCVPAVCPAAFTRAADAPAGGDRAWVARGLRRRTIYHSPQKPGYTCWVGAWAMPDKALMVAFTQATGPVAGRPAAPAAVVEKLGIPKGWDFTGLDRRVLYLRSVDNGDHWEQVGSTPFG